MRIIFFGDIIGRNARDALATALPDMRAAYKPDAVIVNGENAANGFGITAQICDDFAKIGVDCITTGNHIWDQREIIPYIDKNPRLLRPANFPAGTPGRSVTIIETQRGEKILVANIMGCLFMDPLDSPFAAADKILNENRIDGRNLHAIFIDFHAEATSEKIAMGYHCDGRASVVVGTHTHVPTADTHILPKGTGFQTDAGMCGSFDSVIGMDAQLSLGRFTRKMPGERMRPAEGPVTLCGIIADIDSKTGRCTRIDSFRTGGVLKQYMPEA